MTFVWIFWGAPTAGYFETWTTQWIWIFGSAPSHIKRTNLPIFLLSSPSVLQSKSNHRLPSTAPNHSHHEKVSTTSRTSSLPCFCRGLCLRWRRSRLYPVSRWRFREGTGMDHAMWWRSSLASSCWNLTINCSTTLSKKQEFRSRHRLRKDDGNLWFHYWRLLWRWIIASGKLFPEIWCKHNCCLWSRALLGKELLLWATLPGYLSRRGSNLRSNVLVL